MLEYRKRGQVEQYIKEIKNGFDLKHFPCQSLVANRAFGVIAAFAYNLLRLMSFILRTGSIVHYAKLTRQKTLFLPVDVVRTGERSSPILKKFALFGVFPNAESNIYPPDLILFVHWQQGFVGIL